MADALRGSMDERFEKLVRTIFERRFGYTVRAGKNCDFVFDVGGGESVAVEGKLYRTRRVSPSVVRNAAFQLARARNEERANHAVLVLNCEEDPLIAREIKETLGVDLCGADRLADGIGGDVTLLDELEQLRRDSYWSAPNVLRTDDKFPDLATLAAAPTSQPSVSTVGADIASVLSTIPAGREGFQAFERWCTSALKYLFHDEFSDWTEKHASDDKMHEYDLIARLVPRTDLWECIRRDFRSLYVIFEFKNYREPISQVQVYSTEKYLFPIALRGTAVVIARNGADDHARSAARGALRESGKLIILCRASAVIDMLRAKDRGEDVSKIFAGHLDGMLMGLER